MKLRDRPKPVLEKEKDVIHGVETEISQSLPATEVITAANAASSLLQLPQEVKNMIYKHILPAYQVIHVEDRPWKKHRFHLSPCHEDSTEKEAEKKFRAGLEDGDAFRPSMFGWHARCWATLEEIERHIPVPERETISLETALLSSCRQIYHEAKNILCATNTFSFRSSYALRAFICCVGRGPFAKNIAIRKVHLEITIDFRQHEYTWNKALSLMVQKLPRVNSVCITIDQRLRFRYGFPLGVQRVFSDPATGRNNFFLRGILELSKLPLSTLFLIVTETEYQCTLNDMTSMRAVDIAPRWTQAQKLEWARFVKATILGSG